MMILMKKYLLLLLFLGCCGFTFGQHRVFATLNFDAGGYMLLAVHPSGIFPEDKPNEPSELADSLGEFYTDDIGVLNLFKEKWTFHERWPFAQCGFHYTIIICRYGKEVERFYINLECEEIAVDAEKSFHFDPDKLRLFKGKLKKLYSREDDFTDIPKARTSRENMLKHADYLYSIEPDWVKYDGEFNFRYVCKPGSNGCLIHAKALLEQFSKEIKNKYPHEVFELDWDGGSREDIIVQVKCKQTLSEKFDLYPRDWNEWELYKPTLTSYWKSQVKI
jgi:hypothetical protein